MNSNTSKLIVVLVAVIALAAFIKLSNPHKKFSTQEFWLTATISDVPSIPDEALLPKNKNGSVLMWAATVTKDPEIISALIERGLDVNEADLIFTGTPLSGAAAYNGNPEIIDVLVENGAKVNQFVGSNDKTPLIIAAELNPNPEIIERLIFHGANKDYKDLTGKNALEQAVKFENTPVIPTLRKYL